MRFPDEIVVCAAIGEHDFRRICSTVIIPEFGVKSSDASPIEPADRNGGKAD